MLSLADAIRLGSLLHPQAFGDWWTKDYNAHGVIAITATCALGAASVAIGHDLSKRGSPFRAFLDAFSACPVTGCVLSRVHQQDLITHLNDDHRWTRDQIADWVETQERAQARQADVDAVAVTRV